ncbi:hypothetical protein EON64_17565 [archaeon]|nr:MAG: hypothetical protein EON64_17565 [archaeon]
MEEYGDEVFARMEGGAHLYVCGLKGMMPGLLGMLEGVAGSKGLVWADTLRRWKESGQWHVEVY